MHVSQRVVWVPVDVDLGPPTVRNAALRVCVTDRSRTHAHPQTTATAGLSGSVSAVEAQYEYVGERVPAPHALRIKVCVVLLGLIARIVCICVA
jgi:hypothetical protein